MNERRSPERTMRSERCGCPSGRLRRTFSRSTVDSPSEISASRIAASCEPRFTTSKLALDGIGLNA